MAFIEYSTNHGEGIFEVTYNWLNGYVWNKIEISKYVPPADPVAVIGIVTGSARLLVVAHDSSGVKATMTQTIFDTVTRADSARMLLTNSTGGTVFIRGGGIAAKPIVRLSGSEGFIHDRYVDYESIAKNGEIKFELGNDFIVSAAQVTMLADYWWKNSKAKRHIYALNMLGFNSYFEPGEWYTLAIGGAGQQEYVSSVVECYAVRCSQQSGNIGQTQVAFREMYQNWVFDSNEVARSIASGKYGRLPSQVDIVVCGSNRVSPGDFYCDGTADEVEINKALTALSGRGGGVLALQGAFDIATAILPIGSSITIVATNATITTSAAIYMIDAESCSDLKISGINFSTTTGTRGIYANLCTRLFIERCTITGCFKGIELQNCNDGQVLNNVIDGAGVENYGLVLTNSARCLVSGNTVRNLSNGVLANLVTALDTGVGGDNRFLNNSVYNVICTTNDGAIGIGVQGNDNLIQNNRIEGVAAENAISGTGNPVGIQVYGGGNSRNIISGNAAKWNGKNLFDRYTCESATPPALYGEASVSTVSSLFASDSTVAHGGTKSYKFTKQSVTANTCAVYLQDNVLTNDLHGLLTAHTYAFSAYLYMTTSQMVGTNVQMTIDYSSGGAFTTNVATASSTTGSWQTVTETVAIPATMTAVRVGFSVKAASTASSLFCNIDDVEIYDTNPITNAYARQFVDGGTSSMVNINSWQ